MQELSDLLSAVDESYKPTQSCFITDMTCDSRQVISGSLFLAYPGTGQDGRDYILNAIQRGASACLVEARGFNQRQLYTVPVIPVDNLQQKVSKIAVICFNRQGSSLRVMGVTGTNGKTSCAHFYAQLLSLMGGRTAVMGTVGNGVWPDLSASDLTTPDAIECQRQLAQFEAQGLEWVAMEVSSHALDQGRVSAVGIETAIYTGLSRDHLDYHQTMEQYAASKARLLTLPGVKRAVLNWDDPYSKKWVKSAGSSIEWCGFSLRDAPDSEVDLIHPTQMQRTETGFNCVISSPWGKASVIIPLLGEFNVRNVLAVIAALSGAGYNFFEVCDQVQKLQPIVGRMQRVDLNASCPTVVVDYAHTPDALEQALQALRPHCRGQLWCVFGCGGERDRGKRPQMAAVAERFADKVCVTSDNSRNESEQQILEDITRGFVNPHRVSWQLNRENAIQVTVQSAAIDDMVLLAGRGHEVYQHRQQRVINGTDEMFAKKALHEYQQG